MAGSLFFIGLVFLFSTPAVEEVLTLKETSEDASLQSRILVWRNTVKMIADYPLTGFGTGNLRHDIYPVPAPWNPRPLFHGPQRLPAFHLRNRSTGFSHHGLAGDRLLSIWIEKTGASKPSRERLYHWGFVGNIRHTVLQHFRFQPPHPGQRDPVHGACCHCSFTCSTGKTHSAWRIGHSERRKGHGIGHSVERIEQSKGQSAVR